jgi:glycosyltransferase involved in cell wall biosynthesis
MLSSLWPPAVLGGAEVYAEELSRRLQHRGHDLGVVTLGVEGDDVVASVPPWPYRLDQFASQPPWKRAVFHAGDIANVRALRTVLDAVDQFRPDVVHSHSIQGMSALPLGISSRRDVGHVHTIHDYWLVCQRASMTNREGVSCPQQCTPCRAVTAVHRRELHGRGPQVVLCVSEATAREHVRVPEIHERIRVLRLPDGGRAHDERRPAGRPPVFGYLGQLAPHKGVLTLIDAFERLPSGRARLRIAGRGSVEDAVAQRAGGDIDYVGFVDAEAKAAFLDSLDCLVVPSEWREPGALVVSEAKAELLPVIGARIGGIPEVVPPSCTDLLFTPGDATDLARALSMFCAEPVRFAVSPGLGGGWDTHVEGVESAYRDALNLAGVSSSASMSASASVWPTGANP